MCEVLAGPEANSEEKEGGRFVNPKTKQYDSQGYYLVPSGEKRIFGTRCFALEYDWKAAMELEYFA